MADRLARLVFRQRFHHRGERLIGDGFELLRRHALDRMFDPHDFRIDAEGFRLGRGGHFKFRGGDDHAGNAEFVEVVDVMQTARRTGASIR